MSYSDIAVEIKNLTMKFGDFTAVNDISFTVYKGEIFGFLGANGAGKTTTIRILCGLLVPSGGYIKVAGLSSEDGISKIKSRIGYMSQKFTLYNDLTVYENLSFAAGLRKMEKNDFEKRMRELLDFIKFTYSADTFVNNLPSGIKQQIALVSSMIHDPEIIFLDEPTAGVSPESRARFWELIKKLAKSGKTVFVTSHYMDEVENCGRIVLMHEGKIIALDSPENLKKNIFPEKVFETEFDKKTSSNLVAEINKLKLAEIHTYGVKYHLAIKNPAGWESFVKEKGLKIKLKEIVPSLEDVFIRALTKVDDENRN